MSVDATPMIYIGKLVEDPERYLIEKGLLKEGELEDKHGGDIGDMEGVPLTVQAITYYRDCDSYVGFEVSLSEYPHYEEYLDKLKELTGEEGNVHLFTQWS